MSELVKLLPLNILSYLIGCLSRIPLPYPLNVVSTTIFVKATGINMEESEQPLREYRSIGELFVRNLKPGIRPIGEDLVAPVDGVLRSCGEVNAGEMLLVKGRSFSVEKLVGGLELGERFSQGSYFNFYLSPSDYHHIHSPVSVKVVKTVHIAGKLFPVNSWSVRNIDGLFLINERVISVLETAEGLVAVVMVGATNVGRIRCSYDETIIGNSFGQSDQKVIEYSIPPQIQKGDRIGTFELGSSVVLLFDRKVSIEPTLVSQSKSPAKVEFGQRIGI